MPRLIEIRAADPLPAALSVRVGDILFVHAAGVRLNSGSVVSLGEFTTAVIGTDGELHTPEGLPNIVVLQAQRPGQAKFQIVSGTVYSDPRNRSIRIIVQP